MNEDDVPILIMPDIANPTVEVAKEIVYVDRPVEVIKTEIKYIDRIKAIKKEFIPEWIKLAIVLEALAILVLLLK